MFYFYMIQSKKKPTEIYTGSTNNLRSRFFEHNQGKVSSTKRYMPWRLVYYEAYLSEKDARVREQKFKRHGKGNIELKKRLRYSLGNKKKKKGEGFTLTEILIVLAVLLIVLGSSVVAFYTLTRKTDLDTSRDNIISTLNTAKNKTLASEGADQYGVYFDDFSDDTSSDPHKYILFQGLSYVDASFKETHILPATVEISNLSFSGTGDEVVFNRLEGNTDNDGLIAIKFLTTGETRTIYVYSSGEVSTQSEPVSGTGRITDSRHVHFDFGTWSISGADTLKFDFINTGQIEQVPMVDYFTLDSFDWEGEFSVEDVTQKFRIHTHQWDPTILCIHRDRNQGANTQEVYIYIIKDGAENYIVHYDDDEYATSHKGSDVIGDMTPQ